MSEEQLTQTCQGLRHVCDMYLHSDYAELVDRLEQEIRRCWKEIADHRSELRRLTELIQGIESTAQELKNEVAEVLMKEAK